MFFIALRKNIFHRRLEDVKINLVLSPGSESIMASLSLRHIYKKYPGGVTAVSDFCLEVNLLLRTVYYPFFVLNR